MEVVTVVTRKTNR